MLLSLSILALSLHQAPQYHIESKFVQSVEITIDEDYAIADLKVKSWKVSVGLPGDYLGQKLISGSLRCLGTNSGEGQLLEDGSPLKQKYLYLSYNTANDDDKVETFEAKMAVSLWQRRLVPGAPTQDVETLTQVQREHYLESNEDYDFNTKGLRAWISRNELWRRENETDLTFAYRSLGIVGKGMGYSPEQRVDPDAVGPTEDKQAFNSGLTAVRTAGAEGNLSALYVAVLRANGIPARTRFSRRLNTRGANYEKFGLYVFDRENFDTRPEFFVEGVGWVPVEYIPTEPSSVNFSFGVDPGDEVVLGFDKLLFYETGTSRPTLSEPNWILYHGLVYGKTWNGSVIKDRFRWRTLAAPTEQGSR